MSAKKIYKCCICHKVLDYKPIRLVKQLNDNRVSYNAYHFIKNYDFCNKCYQVFDKWVTKHNEEDTDDYENSNSY